MFIKLTRLNNAPIWLNASFVVTVEPRKDGGSVVVPIGDGLDYDVRESPESVLAMLGDAPAAAVVPIPVSDCLTATPDDVSPETEPPAATAETASAGEAPAADAEEKPARKASVRKTPRKPRTPRKPKEEDVVLGDELVERLKRMAPGSVRKLQNTLTAQFKIEDADGAIRSLVARGALTIDHDHVTWAQ